MNRFYFALLCAALGVAGCGDDAESPTTGGQDAGGDTVTVDTDDGDDVSGTDTGGTDTGGTDTGGTDTVTPTDTIGPDGLPIPSSLELSGTCPLETRFGGFLVQAEESYSFVSGEVSNGIVPSNVLEETLNEAGCVLLKRDNPFCDPGCTPGFVCDYDGECITYPEPQQLGTVSVDGLIQAVSMEPPEGVGANYFDATLPHPAMVVDNTIRLQSEGGGFEPFTLYGIGVEPISVIEGTEWLVEEGIDLQLAWAPPVEGNYGEIFISLNIDQHGLSPTTMYCILPDTGSGSVPSAVTDGLIEAGVTGFPSGVVARRTADSTTVGDGCVDLVALSTKTVAVDVIGFTPCNRMTPCPEGLTCNLPLEICE
ncbi:MAG: hypothetical protein ACI81R_002969 [Bradymonadia bacterium]|jgi:hypothetical protein